MRLIHVAARKIEALLPKICQVCACNAIFYAMKTGAVVMGIPAPPSALPTLPGLLVSIFLRHANFLRRMNFPVPDGRAGRQSLPRALRARQRSCLRRLRSTSARAVGVFFADSTIAWSISTDSGAARGVASTVQSTLGRPRGDR